LLLPDKIAFYDGAPLWSGNLRHTLAFLRLSSNTNPLTRHGIDEINEAIPATALETEITPMALTKMDLIDRVSTKLGLLKNKSHEVTESLIEIVKSSLASGEDVLVSGFGKFCVKYKSKRKGRNPATGEDAILPARRVVTFKCSGKLRDKLNGK
jgi:integration host factor subunit alpha